MSKGSVMRKWDLHVHTPESYQHQYKFRDKADTDTYGGNIWQKYIAELEKIEGFCALGITDYFSIAGYRIVREAKRNGRLANFQLILPNIELRLDTFVGGKRLNYHVILSDEIDPTTIEKDFLEELYIDMPGSEKKRLTKENIEHVGRALKEHQDEFKGQTDYYTGCMSITVSLEDVVRTLACKAALRGKYILVLAEPEWSMIDDWKGQDHLTRKNILIGSHAIFSSNPSTRDFALGKKHDSADAFVREFETLKPCLHGSDAHCFEKICVPDLDRFCWIRADATFEGLKQVLYEPADRVQICAENPEYGKNIYTLDSVKIGDCVINKELSFKEQLIQLNSSLVTIIGGKGSGKTALLDLMANCFTDRCHTRGNSPSDRNSFVQRIEEGEPDLQVELQFAGADVDAFSKRLTERRFFKHARITYLPQGRIEEYSGDRKRLDTIIEEIIFNSKEIADADYQQRFDETKAEIEKLAKQISETSDIIFALERESTDEIVNGIKEAISQTQGELRNKEAQLAALKKHVPREAQQRTERLKKKEMSARERYSSIANLQRQCEELQQQLKDFEGKVNIDIQSLNQGLSLIAGDLSIPTVDLADQLEAVRKALTTTTKAGEKVKGEIDKIAGALAVLEGVEKEQSGLLEEKEKINERIRTLKSTLTQVQERRKRIRSLEGKRLGVFTTMLGTLFQTKRLYKEIIDVFSKGKSTILRGISFESSIHFDRKRFVLFGQEILDMRSIKDKDVGEIADMLDSAVNEGSEEEINKATKRFIERISRYKIHIKSSRTYADFYRWTFDNYFSISTSIFFGPTPMDKLSIGQKGTVLLKLFLAEGDCPLVVDQPEESLDNMFIYDELVDAFKQAKTQRQVIIATNNANLVVNADAEQVIVARFRDNVISYEAGAIEDQSIRNDITTILEGGEEALRKRERKYGM